MEQYTGFEDSQGNPIGEKAIYSHVKTNERFQVIFDQTFGFMLMNTKSGDLTQLNEHTAKELTNPIPDKTKENNIDIPF